MRRQRLLLMSAAGILVLSLVPRASARGTVASGPSAGVVVTSHGGLGVWIGGPAVTHHHHHHPPVVHREVVFTRPWHRRFVRIEPPYPAPVVVHRPAVVPPVSCHNGPVTVWITNTNGSRTSVTLTRQGGYYIGPRGEYYTGMPTNEQLRVVYGF